MTPAGCWTGSTAPTGRSSAAGTRMRPPLVAGSPRPSTSSQPYSSSKSTATSAGSIPNPPATPAAVAARPRRGSWSTLRHAPQKLHKPQKPRPALFLWILWFLWRVATPRAAPDESQNACHVIQRERPQPIPAMSGAEPRRQRRSTARSCALAAYLVSRWSLADPTREAQALMGSVSWRKRGNRYLVSWRLDDGSQGGKTVDTPDEARDLAAEKRLEMRRGTWRGRQRGRLPFSAWAAEWWETWAVDDPSPPTLAATDSWLRLHARPSFTDRPIEKLTPADVRRWQAQLARDVGPSTVAHCRSLALRIFQFAMDEGAIDANPVRKVPPVKRRVDPEDVFGEVKRRALTPEEAGRLLACFPLFWWDHVLTLLGTGLRFGELAGLRRRRVHLNRPIPVLEVGPTRYQAGRFGSGFKPRPKSDAGIRPVPLAPLVVEAIHRQLPPGSDPDALVFTGPGGGPGRAGGPSVPRGTRTVLSRHNLHRTYQAAVAKLAGPAVPLRPTARRVLRALRDGGPTRRPARHSTEHVWSSADPPGHRRRRPRRAARCRPSGGRRRRPGRDRRSLVGGADHPSSPAGGGRPARRPRLPPHLCHLAGGCRNPGPRHRRANGPRGHRSQQAAPEQRHGRPLPAHHPGDGHAHNRLHRPAADGRARSGRASS